MIIGCLSTTYEMQIGFYRASLLPLIYVFAIVSLLNAEVFARVENILVLSVRGGHSTLSDSGTTVTKMVRQKSETQCFDIIFSDLDGTLIHYPTDMDAIVSNENATDIISLPPSSTGMSGVISSATLRLIRDIRQTGVKFVLVSGMRASTLLKRMPFLPRADAYCCESGGRIFYPILATRTAYTVQPVPFIGSLTSDLDHFSLVEDLEWRNRIEQEDAAGPDGFVGHELNPDSIYEDVPISLRKGRLWGFAQILVENDFVVDSKGYSTCFRLNRKQQTTSSDFDRLMNVVSSDLPAGLSTSTNLGCIDIYPSFSGKKNCCLHLAKVFGFGDNSLPERCICLCDDDNDLEMALGCLHAFIPQITSPSIEDAVRLYPSKFTVTSKQGCSSVEATERALHMVLKKVTGVGF